MGPDEAVRYAESLDLFGMRFGTERMRALLGELGNPQEVAPAIHVVGTNGKTSTTRFAAAALTSQGVRTGAYVSPHVTGWHERIAVDGEPLTPRRFGEVVELVAAAARRLAGGVGDPVTQFEVLTAAAFVAFADAGVGAMVVEAGLGGRYDATNVFADGAAVVVLTNVSPEHTELLGHTEAAIAAEKLAVAPDGSERLVVGELTEAAAAAVDGICAARGLRGWFAGREIAVDSTGDGVRVRTPGGHYDLRLAVPGRFQRVNAAMGVAAAERFAGAALAPGPLAEAIYDVAIAGRLEVHHTRPLLVFDGAHNPAGVAALVAALPDVVGRRPVVAVCAIFRDKDAATMLATLAQRVGRMVATRSGSARALPPDELAALARNAGIEATVVADPIDALRSARRLAGPDGAVVVCGSLALLADIRNVPVGEGSGHDGMLAAETRRKSS